MARYLSRDAFVRRCALLAIFSLLVASCSVTTEPIAAQAQPRSTAAEAATPTAVPPGPAESATPTPVPASASVPPLPPNANQGAAFDLYIITAYSDYQDSALGAISVAVSGFCSGLVDRESISFLTTDPELQDRILGTPNCDDFETTNAVLQTSESPDAESFDETVNARFERVVWWEEDIAEFVKQAWLYCREERSLVTPGDWRLELSVSVLIELDQLKANGECDLPVSRGLAQYFITFDEPEVQPAASPMADLDLDATLYVVGDSDDILSGEPLEAIHLGSGNRAEIVQLTGNGFPRAGFVSLLKSSANDLVLYGLDDELFVGPSFAEAQLVSDFYFSTPLAFSPDGQFVVFRDSDLQRYSVATGAVRDYPNSPAFVGFSGNVAIRRNCEDETCRISMHDVGNSAELASIQSAPGAIQLSQTGLLLVQEEAELVIIEVTQDGFVERSRTARRAGTDLPFFSPDGQWIAARYEESGQIEIAPSGLTDPNEWVPLIDNPSESRPIQLQWLPDSSGLIWITRGESVKLMDLQGTFFDTGLNGDIPVGIVAGDPEGLG